MSVDVEVQVAEAVVVAVPEVSVPFSPGGVVGREVWVPEVGVGSVAEVSPSGGLGVRLGGRLLAVEESAGAVVFPRAGEPVVLPRGSGTVRGLWVGLVPALEGPVRAGWVSVRVLVGAQVVVHTAAVAELDARRVVTGPADRGTGDAAVALGQVCAMLDAGRGEHEAWKAGLSAAACERADDHGWCGEFDEFMAGWGLSGRSHWFDVEVAVSVRVTVAVEASNAQDAEEAMSRGQVLAAVRDNLDGLDYEVTDVEQT